MKKKLFAGLLFLVILCVAVQGTVAYFTAGKVAHNVITSGEIDIELVETMEKTTPEGKPTEVPYPETPVEGIMPGQAHSKIVRIHNVGTNPAWVRMKVDISVRGENGDDLGADKLSIDFDTEHWEEKSGYYYYKVKLAPGDKTTPLFKTVLFNESMDNDYQNATISIDVRAEGIQYENNETYANAWPEDVPILPLI